MLTESACYGSSAAGGNQNYELSENFERSELPGLSGTRRWRRRPCRSGFRSGHIIGIGEIIG